MQQARKAAAGLVNAGRAKEEAPQLPHVPPCFISDRTWPAVVVTPTLSSGAARPEERVGEGVSRTSRLPHVTEKRLRSPTGRG
ncbi:hypothetical protein EES37_37870 [Streptomyces sp. ADI91-18]|nr:hypothetical protein EES37_37870 [Streptomyces sp. ADI91-18]